MGQSSNVLLTIDKSQLQRVFSECVIQFTLTTRVMIVVAKQNLLSEPALKLVGCFIEKMYFIRIGLQQHGIMASFPLGVLLTIMKCHYACSGTLWQVAAFFMEND